MIDTDKYEGHTPAPWMMSEYKGRPSIYAGDETFVRNIARGLNPSQTADHNLIADSPLLLAEVKRLQKALHTEQQIVQAFYEYRDECCFAHCEAWMIDKGHRVMVNEQSEWSEEE